jgi:hypothetical protein
MSAKKLYKNLAIESRIRTQICVKKQVPNPQQCLEYKKYTVKDIYKLNIFLLYYFLFYL